MTLFYKIKQALGVLWDDITKRCGPIRREINIVALSKTMDTQTPGSSASRVTSKLWLTVIPGGGGANSGGRIVMVASPPDTGLVNAEIRMMKGKKSWMSFIVGQPFLEHQYN